MVDLSIHLQMMYALFVEEAKPLYCCYVWELKLLSINPCAGIIGSTTQGITVKAFETQATVAGQGSEATKRQ